jgi:hypothetical protein
MWISYAGRGGTPAKSREVVAPVAATRTRVFGEVKIVSTGEPQSRRLV